MLELLDFDKILKNMPNIKIENGTYQSWGCLEMA
jgi:hypothetical protein